VQFLVIQHISGATADPNGYESDNHAAPDTNFNNMPRTNPTIYNATLIGNPATTSPTTAPSGGAGTSGQYGNQIITNFKSAAIEVRDGATATQATGGYLKISNSAISGNMTDWGMQTTGDVYDEMTSWAAANGNTSASAMMPAAMTSASAPNFKPTATMTGATPPPDGFFDTSATFIGAIGATDWTTGWTAYPATRRGEREALGTRLVPRARAREARGAGLAFFRSRRYLLW
jgi:hypothetical protein